MVTISYTYSSLGQVTEHHIDTDSQTHHFVALYSDELVMGISLLLSARRESGKLMGLVYAAGNL